MVDWNKELAIAKGTHQEPSAKSNELTTSFAQPEHAAPSIKILFNGDANTITAIDTEVAELKANYLNRKSQPLSSAAIAEAKRIAATKGVAQANEYLKSQQFTGRPPSRTAFMNYLLKIGLEAYRAKNKE